MCVIFTWLALPLSHIVIVSFLEKNLKLRVFIYFFPFIPVCYNTQNQPKVCFNYLSYYSASSENHRRIRFSFTRLYYQIQFSKLSTFTTARYSLEKRRGGLWLLFSSAQLDEHGRMWMWLVGESHGFWTILHFDSRVLLLHSFSPSRGLLTAAGGSTILSKYSWIGVYQSRIFHHTIIQTAWIVMLTWKRQQSS